MFVWRCMKAHRACGDQHDSSISVALDKRANVNCVRSWPMVTITAGRWSSSWTSCCGRASKMTLTLTFCLNNPLVERNHDLKRKKSMKINEPTSLLPQVRSKPSQFTSKPARSSATMAGGINEARHKRWNFKSNHQPQTLAPCSRGNPEVKWWWWWCWWWTET